MKKKNIFILLIILVIITVIFVIIKNSFNKDSNINPQVDTNNVQNIVKDSKVDIIDINSETRPYAISINNTPVAVKVQEGLNNAYLVYEIPTEGNTSRLLALFKDIPDNLTVGTIRSARHNFVDFALESDAIFCCFGWSHYAEDDLKAGSIDYLQGLYGEPFYRNNPENLDSEHTAYVDIQDIKNKVESKGYRTTSNNSILLNYNADDVDLSKIVTSNVANSVVIPYGSSSSTKASFSYDEDSKMYIRYENDVKCVDHNTKEDVSTKNIIVQKVNYKMCDDNYYWDLETVGSGKAYYITNGNYIEINWSKKSRSDKTKYTYVDGTIIDGKNVGGQEILVSDGRTWIEIQTNKQNLTINQ